jgi:hypothetical protein
VWRGRPRPRVWFPVWVGHSCPTLFVFGRRISLCSPIIETHMSQRSESRAPRTGSWADLGFLLSACFGTLFSVCGSVIIYFKHLLFPDDFWRGLWLLLGMTLSGAVLTVLSFVGRRPGPVHRVLVVIRNVLATMLAIVVLAITIFLFLIGPLRACPFAECPRLL